MRLSEDDMRKPRLHRIDDAWIADSATVVGDVHLGEDVSVWYGTVVRGDVASITIGARTNLQDLTLVHPQHDEDVVVGQDNVVGHGVMLHGRTVGNGNLIGMGSIILPGSRIGDECLIAAGALIPVRMEVPDRSVVMGMPGKVVRRVTDDEIADFRDTVRRYLGLAHDHERRRESWRSRASGSPD